MVYTPDLMLLVSKKKTACTLQPVSQGLIIILQLLNDFKVHVTFWYLYGKPIHAQEPTMYPPQPDRLGRAVLVMG
jgi:hypothetical protein